MAVAPKLFTWQIDGGASSYGVIFDTEQARADFIAGRALPFGDPGTAIRGRPSFREAIAGALASLDPGRRFPSLSAKARAIQRVIAAMDDSADTPSLRTVREFLETDEIKLAEIVGGNDSAAIVQSGIDLSAFKKNPVILWQHMVEHPVGLATSVSVGSGKLRATVEFAPEGASHIADTACSLVKAGIVTGVSVGFDPISVTPMDPSKPRGAMRYDETELPEISFVSIPANTNAAVVQRAFRDRASTSTSTSIATLHRRWNTMRALGALPSYETRLAEVRKAFGIGTWAPDAPLSLAARQAELEALAPPLTADELHLCDVAADRGEVLTRSRIEMITAEARSVGMTPAQRYLWSEAAGRWGRTG